MKEWFFTILSGKPTPSDVGWIASLSNYLF